MWSTRRLNDMDPAPWSATPRELTWRATCAAGDSPPWGQIKWKMISSGKIDVESKDDMRKRGLLSPDRADALAYAFAQVEITGVDVESHAGESITGDLMNKSW
jgi:hypothetical protein